jgi:DNA uptake protein ComE-like DNA-binding protein
MTTRPAVFVALFAVLALVFAGPAVGQDKSTTQTPDKGKYVDHPVIDRSIESIQKTINELESRGSEHMGGHRVKAIELLKEANKELREGKAYSRARQDIKAGEIDLNKATADQLRALPGVNEADAKKIVGARPYKTPQDLVSKKVLSQAQYDKIKDQVTVK